MRKTTTKNKTSKKKSTTSKGTKKTSAMRIKKVKDMKKGRM